MRVVSVWLHEDVSSAVASSGLTAYQIAMSISEVYASMGTGWPTERLLSRGEYSVFVHVHFHSVHFLLGNLDSASPDSRTRIIKLTEFAKNTRCKLRGVTASF